MITTAWKVINMERGSAIVSSPYKYKKGALLKDEEGIGFFCFGSKDSALSWVRSWREIKVALIRIQGFGKPQHRMRIGMASMGDSHTLVLKRYAARYLNFAPADTITFKTIKVLD